MIVLQPYIYLFPFINKNKYKLIVDDNNIKKLLIYIIILLMNLLVNIIQKK